MIKTALELAMERASGIKIDPQLLKQKEIEKEGKLFIAKALTDTTLSVKPFLQEHNEDKAILKEAIKGVLLANLTLPHREEDLSKLERVSSLFEELNKHSSFILSQLLQLFSQYLAQRKENIAQLEAHFEPILRQKEQQLAAQTGRFVALTIETYPESAQIYKEQMAMFEAQYQEPLNGAKEELTKI